MVWFQEAIDSINTARDAAKKLRDIYPKNDLLWYLVKPPEGTADPFNGDEEACKIAMKNRFWG